MIFNHLRQIILITGAILSLTSCELADQAQKEGMTQGAISEVIISTQMPEGFKEGVFYKDQEVTLKSDRLTYRTRTDENGNAIFKNVVPNIYSVFTSCELSADTYAELTSEEGVENRPVIVASSLLKQSIFGEQTLTLQLNKSVKQTLLISKIYASGTKDINNKNYLSDKYIELFNNSESVEYIDRLYLALTENESTPAYPAASNPGYFYARQVFRFPGNGTDYPVEPGKSIVICNSAINHLEKAPISANLFEADFEAKSTTYSNNSLVEAIDLIYSTSVTLMFMNLVQGGDNGVVLFKTNDNLTDYPIVFIPGKDKGNAFMRIPDSTILDGVETLKNKTTGIDPNTKRLPSFVDSSYGFINAISGYSNESIERRVDKEASTEERVYLIDTNNSQHDFRTVQDPTPRKYDKPLLLEN